MESVAIFYFSGLELVLLGLITIAGVLLSVMFDFPLVIGFFPGYFILAVLSFRKGVSVSEILKISFRGIQKTKIVIMILFLVSFILPSWDLAGTINQMVALAIQWITPKHFLVFSFIAAGIFSMILGTSIGTLSSIGIPIIGTAVILHIPLAAAAGAVVSGAFVGDRTSPFSSSHQLLASTVELPVKQQFKAMLITTLLAGVGAIIFYSVLDYYNASSSAVSLSRSQPLTISFIKLIPPLVLIAFVMFRVTIVYAFLSSILSAGVIALISGTGGLKIAYTFWYGIEGLGGGLLHMYQLLLFLALAGAFNGLLEELNVIQPILNQWLSSSRSFVSDTLKIMAATLLISMVAANQTLPIILTGRSFLPVWKRKYGNAEIARVMADSTMLFPGMIPWSVLAIMSSTIVGVPLLNYLPYAVFLWGLPLLTFAVSFYKQLKQRRKPTATAA